MTNKIGAGVAIDSLNHAWLSEAITCTSVLKSPSVAAASEPASC